MKIIGSTNSNSKRREGDVEILVLFRNEMMVCVPRDILALNPKGRRDAGGEAVEGPIARSANLEP